MVSHCRLMAVVAEVVLLLPISLVTVVEGEAQADWGGKVLVLLAQVGIQLSKVLQAAID